MLSEPPATPPTYEHRVGSLRRLDRQLELSGVPAYLVPDGSSPYLRVEMGGTYGETVHISGRDGRRCYQWAGGDAGHSLADPAGAARRILIALRRERRDRAGRARS